MKNELKINKGDANMKNYKEFINDKFGQIRVVVIENHNWFIGGITRCMEKLLNSFL